MGTPQERHALRKAIREAARQSQQPGGELENVAPAPSPEPSQENPLAVAIRLLQDAGGDEYHAAAQALDQYVGDIRAALYHQHRTAPQPGQTLAPATAPDSPAIELLNRVCGKLSNHYGGDPAVTWENAPGLVEQLIEQWEELYADNSRYAKQQPEGRSYHDLHRQLSDLSERHGGQMGHEEPLIELTRILIQLEANQKPDGFEQHLQTILGELDRYRMALQSIGLQVQLANVQPLKGGA